MGQIFGRSSNTISRWSIVALIAFVGLGTALAYNMYSSDYVTAVGSLIEQPVPFSHKHHVGGLGIDCRYCHTSVENSSFAGLPPTETCMTCHSQIWRTSPMLEPVRASYESNMPIQWNRIYRNPNFVYFDHHIHVHGGIGCSTCHGQVNEMPLTAKNQALDMSWCLNCHREPERHIRPRSDVFSMDWHPRRQQQAELGSKLVKDYHIHTDVLTSCSTCHR